MTTNIISAVVVGILLGSTVMASAQVSAGSPTAAQQNAASYLSHEGEQNAASNPPREAPKSNR